MIKLTTRQAEALAIIRRVYAETGQGPAVREIGREMGVLSSCTVQRHIEALIKKGFVTKDRYKYRSVRPVGVQIVAPVDLRRLLADAASALEPFAREAGTIAWAPGDPLPECGPSPDFRDYNAARLALEAIRTATRTEARPCA